MMMVMAMAAVALAEQVFLGRNASGLQTEIPGSNLCLDTDFLDRRFS
jgi:hypothetical protein